jgi:hypothetical protein
MGRQTILFSRQYRAALLDYLLGSGETGLSRAYDLGRIAIEKGVGPLQILEAHQKAINALLESSHTVNDRFRSLKAAQTFLMESLSPFEMTYRGYVASLEAHRAKRRGG